MRCLLRAIHGWRISNHTCLREGSKKHLYMQRILHRREPGSTKLPCRFHSDSSTWKKHSWRTMLALILSGQSAILLSSFGNPVFAEEASVADNEQESYTDLRPVEDGSIISNLHTSKWRVFTDRGREFFLEVDSYLLIFIVPLVFALGHGKLDEAEKYFGIALLEAKEGFGATDPHVASSMNNLAELYRVRKHLDKAEPLYIEAINILEGSYGADDIRVAAALHNLGQFFLVQRKFERAHECYERALKIKGRVMGYGNPDYADTMYHLGVVLRLQGKEKDSQDLIKESIRILEENGLGDTKRCVRRMRYLAQAFKTSGQFEEAEALERKISQILDLTDVLKS